MAEPPAVLAHPRPVVAGAHADVQRRVRRVRDAARRPENAATTPGARRQTSRGTPSSSTQASTAAGYQRRSATIRVRPQDEDQPIAHRGDDVELVARHRRRQQVGGLDAHHLAHGLDRHRGGAAAGLDDDELGRLGLGGQPQPRRTSTTSSSRPCTCTIPSTSGPARGRGRGRTWRTISRTASMGSAYSPPPSTKTTSSRRAGRAAARLWLRRAAARERPIAPRRAAPARRLERAIAPSAGAAATACSSAPQAAANPSTSAATPGPASSFEHRAVLAAAGRSGRPRAGRRGGSRPSAAAGRAIAPARRPSAPPRRGRAGSPGAWGRRARGPACGRRTGWV